MNEGLRAGLRQRLLRARRRVASQHQRLRSLLRDAESAARAGEPLRERLLLLREGLAAHFALEDEICFPALHGFAPDTLGQLERLAAEHGEFLDALSRLSDTEAVEPVLRLGEALREHERNEESLFDAVLAGAPAAPEA